MQAVSLSKNGIDSLNLLGLTFKECDAKREISDDNFRILLELTKDLIQDMRKQDKGSGFSGFLSQGKKTALETARKKAEQGVLDTIKSGRLKNVKDYFSMMNGYCIATNGFKLDEKNACVKLLKDVISGSYLFHNWLLREGWSGASSKKQTVSLHPKYMDIIQSEKYKNDELDKQELRILAAYTYCVFTDAMAFFDDSSGPESNYDISTVNNTVEIIKKNRANLLYDEMSINPVDDEMSINLDETHYDTTTVLDAVSNKNNLYNHDMIIDRADRYKNTLFGPDNELYNSKISNKTRFYQFYKTKLEKIMSMLSVPEYPEYAINDDKPSALKSHFFIMSGYCNIMGYFKKDENKENVRDPIWPIVHYIPGLISEKEGEEPDYKEDINNGVMQFVSTIKYKYVGSLWNGKRHGYGACDYPEKNSWYEGSWKNDEWDYGVYHKKRSCEKYVVKQGAFSKNKTHGYGSIKFTTMLGEGFEYTGPLFKGVPHTIKEDEQLGEKGTLTMWQRCKGSGPALKKTEIKGHYNNGYSESLKPYTQDGYWDNAFKCVFARAGCHSE